MKALITSVICLLFAFPSFSLYNSAARNASKDDDQAVQLYNESLEYFEAVQAAVNSAGHMKNRAARLREALGTLPNSTIEEQLMQQQHQRVKRSVLDLASMIKCITGCNPWSYKDYGCYCGFQGDGYPVDGIDR